MFDGNTVEVKTLKPTLEKIIKRFPIKRVIAMAGRGLLSTNNLSVLQPIRLPGGGKLEFILAVPGRRYTDFVEILQPLHDESCAQAKQEVVGETVWGDLRLIVAPDPHVAAEATVPSAIYKFAPLRAKPTPGLENSGTQDEGKKKRGRKLSDGGARARFYREASDLRLSRIVRVDLRSELFAYDINDKALAHARLMDGKLLLVSNTAATDLPPPRSSSATSH